MYPPRSRRELHRLSYDPGHIYVDVWMLRMEKSGKISRAVRFCCAPTCSRTVLWCSYSCKSVVTSGYLRWGLLVCFYLCVHAMPILIRILRGRDKRFKCTSLCVRQIKNQFSLSWIPSRHVLETPKGKSPVALCLPPLPSNASTCIPTYLWVGRAIDIPWYLHCLLQPWRLTDWKGSCR